MTETLHFLQNYAAELVGTASESGRVHWFPNELQAGTQSSTYVSVALPSGDSWTGVFARGALSPKGVTGIFAMPDPYSVCVAAGGTAYIVNVTRPDEFAQALLDPVLQVMAAPEVGILLLAGYTDAVAYNAQGFAWRSDRISVDGLTVTGIDAGCVCGHYFDQQSNAEQAFRISVKTGKRKT